LTKEADKLEEDDIALTATVTMVRLVSLVSPFIVVTLAVVKCPEGSVLIPARGGCFADHLAVVVDAGSLAEVATGEEAASRAEVAVFAPESANRFTASGAKSQTVTS
jgi:hypothetical protein